MSHEETFWAAFEDEIKKEAGLEALLPKLLGTVTRAKRMAFVGAGRLGQKVQATRGGQWLAAHPRLSKVLGFGGVAVAEGAGSELGMLPFQRRKRIIEVVPGQEPIQESMLLRQYRRGS